MTLKQNAFICDFPGRWGMNNSFDQLLITGETSGVIQIGNVMQYSKMLKVKDTLKNKKQHPCLGFQMTCGAVCSNLVTSPVFLWI